MNEFKAYGNASDIIAALVDIPSRGLFQIINPMVSEVLSKNNLQRLKNLLEKSAKFSDNSKNPKWLGSVSFLFINLDILTFQLENSFFGFICFII